MGSYMFLVCACVCVCVCVRESLLWVDTCFWCVCVCVKACYGLIHVSGVCVCVCVCVCVRESLLWVDTCFWCVSVCVFWYIQETTNKQQTLVLYNIRIVDGLHTPCV